MTSSDIRPPDLEMRVQIVPENGQTRLLYTLHSPTGVAPFVHREIRGPAIQGSPDSFHGYFRKKIEQLGDRLDIEGETILRADIERKLANLGRQLFRELFPPELCHAYRDIRRTVRTWMIISDDPWIPWELIKPFDDSRPDERIDDDFLARRFELTRWLAGSRPPSLEIKIRRLAAIQTAKTLQHSAPEAAHLAQLAISSSVEDASPTAQSPGDLLRFLETGGVQLLHFIGHGTFADEQAEESAIPLPNGRPIRPNDLEGPVTTRINQDRPLVFLNACWGGQQGWSLTRTGGWVAHWVGVCGCGAFVAPLWPVRDEAASEFARVFYEALWRGATLGGAAHEAREHLRATRPPGDPSVLAYTVYGNPNARVRFGEREPTVQKMVVDPSPVILPWVQEVYFGAADRQMEDFLQPGTFEHHLLMAVLFQGNLVIPDIFFFISRNIRDSVFARRGSHLLAALRRGLVIPTFRSTVGGSFRKVLKEIKDQGIQGLLPEAERIAEVLDRTAESSARYSYRGWPEGFFLSEGFEKIVRNSLLELSPDLHDSDFARVWESTMRLRETALQEAIERTSIKGAKGLRRGEIYNAVARFYEVETTTVDDVGLLFQEIGDPADAEAARRVVKWANYCYHFNQGKTFGLRPALVEMEGIDLAFVIGLHQETPGARQANTLSASIRIPSVEQLMTIDPGLLLDIRESESGARYFHLLDAWQKNPTEHSAEHLLDALQEYGHAITICNLENGRNLLRPEKLLHAAFSTASNPAGSFLLNRLISLAGVAFPPFRALGFVADTATGLYCLLPEEAKEKVGGLVGAKELVSFELETERQLIRKGDQGPTTDGVFC